MIIKINMNIDRPNQTSSRPTVDDVDRAIFIGRGKLPSRIKLLQEKGEKEYNKIQASADVVDGIKKCKNPVALYYLANTENPAILKAVFSNPHTPHFVRMDRAFYFLRKDISDPLAFKLLKSADLKKVAAYSQDVLGKAFSGDMLGCLHRKAWVKFNTYVQLLLMLFDQNITIKNSKFAQKIKEQFATNSQKLAEASKIFTAKDKKALTELLRNLNS